MEGEGGRERGRGREGEREGEGGREGGRGKYIRVVILEHVHSNTYRKEFHESLALSNAASPQHHLLQVLTLHRQEHTRSTHTLASYPCPSQKKGEGLVYIYTVCACAKRFRIPP